MFRGVGIIGFEALVQTDSSLCSHGVWGAWPLIA